MENNIARNYRRQVNELETSEDPLENQAFTDDISELRRPRENKLICYNCKTEGHTFRQCNETPTIFCYSCGKPGVYKSNCDVCAGNLKMGNGNNSSHRPN